jgi:hypothetical protein
MGRLVEFGLNDGGTILVEVHETARTGGPVTGASAVTRSPNEPGTRSKTP